MRWDVMVEASPDKFERTEEIWDDGFPNAESSPERAAAHRAKMDELRRNDPEHRTYAFSLNEGVKGDAKQVEKAGKDDGGSGAQSGVRKEDGDTGRGGKGVQSGGQRNQPAKQGDEKEEK